MVRNQTISFIKFEYYQLERKFGRIASTICLKYEPAFRVLQCMHIIPLGTVHHYFQPKFNIPVFKFLYCYIFAPSDASYAMSKVKHFLIFQSCLIFFGGGISHFSERDLFFTCDAIFIPISTEPGPTSLHMHASCSQDLFDLKPEVLQRI